MIIGVDAGCLGITDKRLQVGVFQVVKNLLVELGKKDKKNSYILYSFHPISKKLLKLFGPQMKNVVVAPSRGWLAIWLPIRLWQDKPDVFLALNQSAPLRLPMQKYKVVGLFYDIAFEKYPELYAYAASVVKHSNNSKYLATVADKIITISKATKKDLHALYNVSLAKMHVAYPGIVPLPKGNSYKNKVPYFLFVGSFKKSKNIPILLRAFEKFSMESQKPFELFLVGGNKWPDEKVGEVYTSLPEHIQERITFFSFVNEKLLSSLYKGATAFVSPSWYEGFGLSFVEAQSFGCPVISSNKGALPEVIGNSGILVNPAKEAELVKAMKEMANSSSQKMYIKRGYKNVKQYTWKNFAKQVQSTIESLS